MKEMTEEANIFTLYSDNKPFYIGKTTVTKDGKIKMTYLGTYYANRKLNQKVKAAKNFKIRVVARTSNEAKEWFNEKLRKHQSYLEKKYKLINSKNVFGLNGYGYWTGKKRDKHTLKRLEESKFKPIAQFTRDGKFVREWPSAKHAAKHYRVYRLENGSGGSVIHDALLSKSRVWRDWVWYKISELKEIYNGVVPQQLHKLEYEVPTSRIKTLIVKYNDKNKVVDFYYTADTAAKTVGTTAYFLKQNLNTGNKFNGYIWKTHELRGNKRITQEV